MGKSIIAIFAAIGAATLSATAPASEAETSSPASGGAGNASAAEMAAAYWAERSGDLPPNRPVIDLTPPRQARHSPPSAAQTSARDLPGVTVPAGRSN